MNAESIRQLAGNLPEDEEALLEIYQAAKELMLRAEPPRDTCFRLFTSVGAGAAGVTAVDLGLFHVLAKEPTRAFSIQELSDSTGAEASLLVRLLRTLAAWGYVAHAGPDAYQATNNTKALTTSLAGPLAQIHTQLHGPMFTALPSLLKENGYKNPTDTSHTAFHQSYNTKLPVMEWLDQHPEWFEKLMVFFRVHKELQLPWMPRPEFLQGFDIALSEDDLKRGRAQFVDVGGSVGHQCIAFRENNPGLKGPIILQDVAFTVESVQKDSRLAELGITAQTYDFLTPQTPEAQGAKIFYIRNVLHDWDDSKCLQILKNISAALADDSFLIIDEAVVPDENVAVPVAAYDMTMMAFLAAQERTEGLWRNLVEQGAGLKIRDIRSYDQQTSDSLIFITKQ